MLHLLVVILNHVVDFTLLLSSVLFNSLVEGVDSIVLLEFGGELVGLQLLLLELSVFLVQEGAQVTDLFVFGRYDLVLLLVNEVPVLVLFDD